MTQFANNGAASIPKIAKAARRTVYFMLALQSERREKEIESRNTPILPKQTAIHVLDATEVTLGASKFQC